MDWKKKIPRARRWLNVAWTAGGRLSPKTLVLLYHRVAEVDLDPWSLCVQPRHFAEHLEVLKEFGRPLQLRQLINALENGRPPRQSVVLTFDDGYADNLYQARPLLERYDIPATVFVATGYLGCRQGFWWDELFKLLLQSVRLPETLRLRINGRSHHWELNREMRDVRNSASEPQDWSASDHPTNRQSLYRSLWQLLQPLPEGERRQVLSQLREWAASVPENQTADRPLTDQEVARLAQSELVEVGAHTVTHPMLSTQSSALQRNEVRQSKARLETILESPVTSFSYPYGDYTGETVAAVREAGYGCACTTREAAVGWDTDRFRLPRLQVQDWDGEEFARWLRLKRTGS